MHIDQIVVGAAVGDAVTESAIRIRNALRNAVESNIYAFHREPNADQDIGLMEHYPLPSHRSPDDIIVYHVSIGEPGITDFVLHRSERLVLVYHNMTPASFFRDVDPVFADLLDAGRRELPTLLDRAEAVIAVSEFNANELRAMGRHDVVVAAPPLNLRRLLDVEPDPQIQAILPVAVPGKMLLFVGQVLPHKRPDLLVAAHHLLVTNDFPDARLVIAGPSRNKRYANALRRYIDDLALDTVWFTGGLTDGELAAMYRRADVVVTASEHEGFCVPIVEAFNHDVPVIARDFGAVAETARGAALVLPSDTGARHMAEAMRRVLTDDALRDTLVARGRERREHFTVDRTTAGMLDAIRLIVSGQFGRRR